VHFSHGFCPTTAQPSGERHNDPAVLPEGWKDTAAIPVTQAGVTNPIWN